MMPIEFRKLLADAKIAERSVPICLRGDLAADHAEAERQLAEAQKRGADSLAGDGTGLIIAWIRQLETEMAEHTYPFRLRALPKAVFKKMVEDHPPRRGEDGAVIDADRYMMCNSEEMLPALVRACVYDPELSEADWAELEEKLTHRQLGDLDDAAWFVNRGEVDVPFSRAASLLSRNSADE